ncbi:MAG: DUF1080 domain-containing protein [Pirellulales bacterium]
MASSFAFAQEARPLFNGKDLSGWRGQGMVDPVKWNEMDVEKRKTEQAKYDEDLAKHWSVKDGEIVNDGKGVYLTTAKDYGDFELTLDWKMVAPNGDSGVYLRGYPQVQIWDPANPKEVKNGADKGSGALWNNSDPKNGKFPPVVGDKPIGEWNTLKIVMKGEHVTIHLNDKLVVDHATLDNYYKRGTPLSPVGPIQLQTHGSEMRFRNITLKDLSTGGAKK